ncbi:hypothetical protein LJB42_001297 [Komagataella kurtzmanii]|nr:hypothetical protein LJB42_001297 [Komagataella kurtzmanii]
MDETTILGDTPLDAVYSDRVRRFQDFLTSPDLGNMDNIKKMLTLGQRRLAVSLDEIRETDKDFWLGLLNTPADYLPACQDGVKEAIKSIYTPIDYPDIEITSDTDFYVSFKGSFGDHQLTPRTIGSHFLSKMVSVEGIVTRASLIRPKIIKSVHYCDATGRFHQREYSDQTTSFNPITTSALYPTEDPEGNPLTTEYGFSKYRDHQTITIQELPELAPAGQLPRSLDVIMDDDLVDLVKPGDRLQAVGVYRSLGGVGSNSSSFRTVILCNSVYPLHARSTSVKSVERLTNSDIRNINKLSKKKNIFDLMAQSLAPSIYGHAYIKKAVLLMLLGGYEKNLSNGAHLRGDINLLMVGDPSTAKSQMLRFVLNTAPLAIATTGRGSSGVGLTAAVTTDKETGERRLEAGAMVLADRGIVCIDEFDKMSDIDRVAIHEVMEQQTITIAKAGIHTSLNARCSVIAAANPVYGQYDTNRSPQQNIALPDSLLSRFDLLFIVTDDISDEKDKAVSEHVLRMHRFIPQGYSEGEPIRERRNVTLAVGDSSNQDEDDSDDRNKVYEKFSPLLHSGAAEMAEGSTSSSKKTPKVLNITFLKKYIQYAKQRIEPQLTTECTKKVVEFYATLRNDHIVKNSPITARTLETIIRLATAHAKVRLSQTVEIKDVQVAEEMLRFSLLGETPATKHKSSPQKSPKKKRKTTSPSKKKFQDDETELYSVSESEPEYAEDKDDGNEDADVADYQPRATTARTRSLQERLQSAYDEEGEDEDMEEELVDVEQIREGLSQQTLREPSNEEDILQETNTNMDQPATISASRFSKFKSLLSMLRSHYESTSEDGSAPVADLVTRVNQELSQEEQFDEQEAYLALEQMQEKNFIQISEEKVYFI